MLNELLALERGLSEYGFAPVARHPDLSQLLKGDAVRVRLAPDGAIAEIERLDGKTRPEIWTLRDGKHNGFPGLKTGRGLIELDAAALADHDKRWKSAKSPAEKRAELERLVAGASLDPTADSWPKPGHRARITERLGDLRSLVADSNACAVPATFERFLLSLKLNPMFLHRLYDALLDRVRNEDGWLDVAHSALVDAVPLAMDVTRDFSRDAGDRRQIDAVSRALSGGQGVGDLSVERGVCAFTGAETRLLAGNFPQPTLPGLGQTYLFSRNTDIRALARYGRNGPSSVPVDANLVARFSGALAMVTEEKRRGRTWRLLPAEAGDGQDLFIVFAAAAEEEPLADSFLIGDDEVDDETDAVRIGQPEAEHAASTIVSLWSGVAKRASPSELARILLLRTVDLGNRKSVYDRSRTVSALHQAAQEWDVAMANAPDWLEWPVFKQKKLSISHVLRQAPLTLIALSKKIYVRGGREAVDAPGIGGAEALALFLNEGDRPRRARYILRFLLDRQHGLLAGLAHANRREQLANFDGGGNLRRDGLGSVAWLGALLWFIGRTKESFMDETGFKLGQLLAATDAVHLGYCFDVRAGQIPPTLVGNSVFATAGRSPDRALDVLCTRWKPYHAWATRAARLHFGGTLAKDDSKGWSVRRAISQARLAGQLCEELQPSLAALRASGRGPDEVFRAELLLGYLAGLKPEPKSYKPTENEDIA